MNAYLKSWAFFFTSAVSFVIFCWLLRSLVLAVSAAPEGFSFSLLALIFGFFFLTLAGIVYASLLSQRLYFIFFPLLFPVILGSVFFLAPLQLFLVFGVPFAYLYIAVKQAIKNRIAVHFGSDIRRPITTAYLILFFFGSFAIAPFFDEAIRLNAATLFAKILPETIEVEGRTIDLDATIDELVEQEVENNLELCQGNADCEVRLREEMSRQVRQQFETSPMFAGVEVKSETPLVELLVAKVLNEIDRHPFFVALQENGIPVAAVWGLLIFLLISPFTILFSLVTVLLLAFGFELLKLIRVFRVFQQDVKQDVIR